MHLISSEDLAVLLAALSAVTPSGGGGPELSLYSRLSRETGVTADENLTHHYANNAVEEYLEYTRD